MKLKRDEFTYAMMREYYTNGVNMSKSYVNGILNNFLKSAGIKYGDDGHVWDVYNAKQLVIADLNSWNKGD